MENKDTNMELEKTIKIRMNIIGPCSSSHNGPMDIISSVEELRRHAFRFKSPIPYTVNLTQIEYIIDTGKIIGDTYGMLGQRRSINNHPIVKDAETGEYGKEIDTLKIFIGNSYAVLDDLVKFFDLQYNLNEDTKLFLKRNYNLDLDFCDKDRTNPVILDKVKWKFCMITDKETGKNTLKMVPVPQFHYLTEDDIFVDQNLCDQSGQTPITLINFFKCKTEPVKGA